jgi:hypothetical protein
MPGFFFPIYASLKIMKALQLLIIAAALCGCSAESIRQGNKVDLAPMSRDAERNAIRERGQNFCTNYPDDEACRGPKK